MKVWSLLPLLFLVSCLAGKDSGSPEKSDPGIQCLCLEIPNWSVISKKKDFPKNFKISYEGAEVLNTCTDRKKPVRETSNNEFVIKYQVSGFPTAPFQFEIVDLGDDCFRNEVFFTGTPMYSTAIVTQEGQRKDYQVYVYLDQ